MNELAIFNNQEFASVRVINVNCEPWFVGKDVCNFFGDSNYRRSISNVDSEDKMTSQVKTNGGMQNMILINESGLYSLLFQMQPQKAKGVSQNEQRINERIEKIRRFKHWVTSEVLPTLRKTGGYTMPKTYLEALKAFTAEVEKNEMLSLENKIQTQQINELKPKADYTDRILKTTDLMTTTQIAKDYGMSAKQFNALLHDYKVQFKQNGQWLLYSQYQSKGYTSSETVEFDRPDGTVGVRLNTKWTQKGRLFLYGLLKKHDVVPTIERLF